MKVSYSKAINKSKYLLVIPVFQKKEKINKGNISKDIGKYLDKFNKKELFKGKYKETLLVHDLDKNLPFNILFIGFGEDDLNKEKLNDLGALAAKTAQDKMLLNIQIDLNGLGTEITYKFIEGFFLQNYNFAKYKTGDELKELNSKLLKSIDLVCEYKTKEKNDIKNIFKIIEGVSFTKRLVCGPSNEITPTYLANAAKKMAKEYKGLKAKIFKHKDLMKMKMGLIMAVNSGSDNNDAHLIELEWNPNNSKEDPIIIVGKGITYDTGGYDIKPTAYMNGMHFDMAGAAAILGTMKAIASLGIKKRVIGLVPTTANLISSNAYRPNDIHTSYSGKTVEILNTDAEGRLILADALAYGAKKKPKYMVDLATLTGAIVVALGYDYAGIYSFDEDLVNKTLAAGINSGDEVWHMPLTKKHQDRMKSKIADLKNISDKSCGAGSATAAGFLSHFVGESKWLHMDIAGSGWHTPAKSYHTPEGFSGFGVRVLVDLIAN